MGAGGSASKAPVSFFNLAGSQGTPLQVRDGVGFRLSPAMTGPMKPIVNQAMSVDIDVSIPSAVAQLQMLVGAFDVHSVTLHLLCVQVHPCVRGMDFCVVVWGMPSVRLTFLHAHLMGRIARAALFLLHDAPLCVPPGSHVRARAHDGV